MVSSELIQVFTNHYYISGLVMLFLSIVVVAICIIAWLSILAKTDTFSDCVIATGLFLIILFVLLMGPIRIGFSRIMNPKYYAIVQISHIHYGQSKSLLKQ